MKRSPAPWLPAALLLSMSLTGCLGFKEQTLAFRLDVQHDTLRVFQVYHGIFAEPHEKPGLDEEEREQLESVLTTERTFFFANWVYEINKAHIAKELADLHDPHKPKAEPRPGDYTEEERKRAAYLGKLVMENVHIENGTFYFDAKHQLCGTQQVTITKWSDVLAAGNAALRDMLRHMVESTTDIEEDEKAALLSRIEQVPSFLRLQDNGLLITLPIPRKEYDSPTEDHPAAAGDAVPESLPAAFRRQGGKISYADHQLTIAFSAPSAAPPMITLPTASATYSDNVVQPLKEKKQVIKDTFDVGAARRAFLNAK